MRVRRLGEIRTKNKMISVFGGYDARERIHEGCIAGGKNLSLAEQPLLSSREGRVLLRRGEDVNGMAVLGEDLYHVSQGQLFCGSTPVDGIELEEGEKQLIAYAGKLLIFPDCLSFSPNGEEGKRVSRFGDAKVEGHVISVRRFLTESGTVEVTNGETGVKHDMSVDAGTPFMISYADIEAEPADGEPTVFLTSDAVWRFETYEDGVDENGDPIYISDWMPHGCDTSHLEYASYLFSSELSLDGIFSEGDRIYMDMPAGVKSIEDKREWHTVIKEPTLFEEKEGLSADTHGVWFSGFLIDERYVENGEVEGLILRRPMPRLDFVYVHGNRLWGCRYGMQEDMTEKKEVFVNEIYASALGNERNFYSFDGTDADSYAVTVAPDGSFTGMIEHGGYLVAFKENAIISVGGGKPSSYHTSVISAVGVEAASPRSLVRGADGAVYYKAAGGIYRYSGAIPALISPEFGAERYGETVAGVMRNRLFFSMAHGRSSGRMMVYDTDSGIWCPEDESRALEFLSFGGNLIMRTRGAIWCLGREGLDGICSFFPNDPEYESDIPFLCEFGDFGLESPGMKYVTRLRLRMTIEAGARLRVQISHDGGDFVSAAVWSAKEKESVILPFVTSRCEHFRIRLEGVGGFRLWSMAMEIEEKD